MKTTTALATPIPPSSRAISATRPRYPVRRDSVSLSRSRSSATVRSRTRSPLQRMRRCSVGDRLGGDGRRAAADRPRTRRGRRSRGAGSPSRNRRRDEDAGPEGRADADVARERCATVPLMTKRASPRASVSPTRARSAVSSDGSTTTRRPLCSSRHAAAGSVSIRRRTGSRLESPPPAPAGCRRCGARRPWRRSW